jgi:hypothetical protein
MWKGLARVDGSTQIVSLCQRNINKPYTTTRFVTLKIGIVVVKEGENGSDDERNTLPIGTGTCLEIHTKGLFCIRLVIFSQLDFVLHTVDGVVVVLICCHPGDELTSPVVLKQVPEVTQRLHRLLEEHHIVDSAL